MKEKFIRQLQDKIFDPDFTNFNDAALELFQYQAANNQVYKTFLDHIRINPKHITELTEIPFMPIEFFKTHRVMTGNFVPQTTFYSSGTTSQSTAHHHLKLLEIYEHSFLSTFEQFFGPIKATPFLALLPSYMENPNASLIYMAKTLIENSGHPSSGFFLDNFKELQKTLTTLKNNDEPIILLGVSFALLELAEQYPVQIPEAVVMETGGMKGKRREMVRAELHEKLKAGFGKTSIQSEYGMTELLSQAYAYENGIFQTPPWMKVLIRNPYDPFEISKTGKGALNIIDLANLHSCAFLATQDLGVSHNNGSFEVLGRYDNSDIRGCNLLVA